VSNKRCNIMVNPSSETEMVASSGNSTAHNIAHWCRSDGC
jgi:hypothetical protein